MTVFGEKSKLQNNMSNSETVYIKTTYIHAVESLEGCSPVSAEGIERREFLLLPYTCL